MQNDVTRNMTKVAAYENAKEYGEAAKAGIECADAMIEINELESAHAMSERTKKNISKALENGQIDIQTAEGLGREIAIIDIALENGFRNRGRGPIGPTRRVLG